MRFVLHRASYLILFLFFLLSHEVPRGRMAFVRNVFHCDYRLLFETFVGQKVTLRIKDSITEYYSYKML